MVPKHGFLVAAILLGGITFAGCDTDAHYAGVTLTDNRSIRVLYSPCGKEVKIFRVALAKAGHLDTPLWEIRAQSGVSMYDFTIGEDLVAFSETVVLGSTIPSDELLVVSIDSSRYDGEAYGFRLSQLKPGLFFDESKYYTEEEVLAGKLCD